jgi:pilin isopeptide linkage protein
MIYQIDNAADFKAALENQDNQVNIVLTGSFATTSVLFISDGKSVTLEGKDNGPFTVSGTATVLSITDGVLNIGGGVVLTNSSEDSTILYTGQNAGGKISGGRIEGQVALRIEEGAVVDEISGGEFVGQTYAIYVDTEARIDAISGGKLTGGQAGIYNLGYIGTIGGDAEISGEGSAVICTGGGKIGAIQGGTFWGKNGAAIVLEYGTPIEPGLDTDTGKGRYQGKDGIVFNIPGLAVYPANYSMSDKTLDGFKYLTLALRDGNVRFSCINISEAGVYRYTIRETSDSGDGWTADTKEYAAVVTVTDDGNGNLVSAAEYPDGFPEFVNKYAAQSVCVNLFANKTAVGAPLPYGKFEFGVFDEEGNLVASAQNTDSVSIRLN